MTRRLLWAAATFLVSTPAFAASADLSVSIPATAATPVYEAATYTVNVDNVGNRNANAVSLTVDLPTTNTSPTIHVMGEVDGIDSACNLVGTQLQCSLGRIRKNQSASITFDLELPEAAAPLSFTATASTAGDSNTSNDSATYTPTLLHASTTIQNGDASLVNHCTGTGLTSFFECTLYPSSINSHPIEFHGNGTLSFPNASPDYTGAWEQLASDHLSMTYSFQGTPVAEFEGYGTSPGCFEGLTTFPQSPGYVSPYEVCL